jgi:hypothetical protein
MGGGEGSLSIQTEETELFRAPKAKPCPAVSLLTHAREARDFT